MIQSSMPFASLRHLALRGLAIALFMVCAAQSGQAAYLTLGHVSPAGSDNYTDNYYITGPGQDVTLAVTLVNDSPSDTLVVGGTDLSIQWDPTLFSFVSWSNGNLGTTFFGSPNLNNSNAIYYNTAASSPQSLGPNASGTLLIFTLHVASPAPGGIFPVNLLFANPISGVETDVTDELGNVIPLNPAPTDGYDAMIDAQVAVPEPSSVVLMGLGLSTTFLYGLRRRFRRS